MLQTYVFKNVENGYVLVLRQPKLHISILERFWAVEKHAHDISARDDATELVIGVYNRHSAHLFFDKELDDLGQGRFFCNRRYFLAELDRLGINEATLFPEVDKVASYLKQR